MNHIKIIGTSHIAKESVEQITREINENKPDIVAVELDAKRFQSLVSKEKASFSLFHIGRIGIKGYIFGLIGHYGSKKLGKLVGMEPGDDMMTAINLARENNIQIALIDQEIEITLKRISMFLTWKEKFNFLKDIFSAVFRSRKMMKELGINTLDLTKVPPKKLILKLMERTKIRYPNLYKVLVEERNIYMANAIKHFLSGKTDKKMLVIIGAGHEQGIRKILSG